MNAGVRIPLIIARFTAEGLHCKQLKFAAPYGNELADLHFDLNLSFRDFISQR